MEKHSFQEFILKVLFVNSTARDKVVPYLDAAWFIGEPQLQEIVQKILFHVEKYDKFPTEAEMGVLLKGDPDLLLEFQSIMTIEDEDAHSELIIDQIEDFVKRKLLYSISTSIRSYACQSPEERGESRDSSSKESFLERLEAAEGFSLGEEVAFDLVNDLEKLSIELSRDNTRISTGVSTLDSMLGGGIPNKIIMGVLASTNVGKTLILTSMAASAFMSGKKVLYVTFEDSQEKIAKRVIQNLCDLSGLDLQKLGGNALGKVQEILAKNTEGSLKILELEEATVSSSMLNSMLKSLKEKEKFVPDIIFIDYVGCMIPNGRLNIYLNTNSILQKVVAELRGSISIGKGIPLVTAFQANRGAYNNESLDLDDIADSFGSTTKVDLMFAVTQNPSMKSEGIYRVFVAKTRLKNNKGEAKIIKVDIDKQRISDLETEETIVRPVYQDRLENIRDATRQILNNPFFQTSIYRGNKNESQPDPPPALERSEVSTGEAERESFKPEVPSENEKYKERVSEIRKGKAKSLLLAEEDYYIDSFVKGLSEFGTN